MTGSNVLDKSAMAALARLENELPHIGQSIMELAEAQRESNRAIHRVCKELAVVTAQSQRNTDDIKGLSIKADSLSDDVVGLKTTNKILGGANALYTTIATVLTNVLNGGMS